jgi:hypothetical protein
MTRADSILTIGLNLELENGRVYYNPAPLPNPLVPQPQRQLLVDALVTFLESDPANRQLYPEFFDRDGVVVSRLRISDLVAQFFFDGVQATSPARQQAMMRLFLHWQMNELGKRGVTRFIVATFSQGGVASMEAVRSLMRTVETPRGPRTYEVRINDGTTTRVRALRDTPIRVLAFYPSTRSPLTIRADRPWVANMVETLARLITLSTAPESQHRFLSRFNAGFRDTRVSVTLVTGSDLRYGLFDLGMTSLEHWMGGIHDWLYGAPAPLEYPAAIIHDVDCRAPNSRFALHLMSNTAEMARHAVANHPELRAALQSDLASFSAGEGQRGLRLSMTVFGPGASPIRVLAHPALPGFLAALADPSIRSTPQFDQELARAVTFYETLVSPESTSPLRILLDAHAVDHRNALYRTDRSPNQARARAFNQQLPPRLRR